MDKRKMKKLLILNLPYFLVGLFATNLGEAWRLAEGADSSAKILSFFHALPIALNNPFPSFHPLDLLIGILCGAGLRLAVYDDVLRNRERERLTQRGFADLKTQELSVYIPTLKNGGLLRNILPCQRGHLGRRKALIYATCRERKQNK